MMDRSELSGGAANSLRGRMILDSEARIIACDEACTELLGESKDRLVGIRLDGLMEMPVVQGPVDAPASALALGLEKIKSDPLEMHCSCQPPNCRAVWLVSLSRERRCGRPSELTFKRVESRADTRRIAHGLNNALTVALANLEFLSRVEFSAETENLIHGVVVATKRIHSLAKELHSSTKTSNYELSDLNAEDAIRSAATQLERVVAGRVQVDLDSIAVAAFPLLGVDLQNVVVILGVMMLDIVEGLEVMVIRLSRGRDGAVPESGFLEIVGAVRGGKLRREEVTMPKTSVDLVESIVGVYGGKLEFVGMTSNPRFVVAIPIPSRCG